MTDLTVEFDQGRLAWIEGTKDCPHYATSLAANAWHVGWAYEASRPSVYAPERVWAGLGTLINVLDAVGHPRASNAPVFKYRVSWNKGIASVKRVI
jgi:hypothetical protein